MSSASRLRYEKYLEEYAKKDYIEALDILKIEFGDFLRNAEIGKNVSFCGLKARKLSIKLRDMMKIFREKSLELENEKRKVKEKNEKNKNLIKDEKCEDINDFDEF